MEKFSGLTLFSIATSNYLNYWSDLVDSCLANLDTAENIQWLLLTDRVDQIPPHIRLALGENLVVRRIEHSEWPYPTLLRYEYLLDSAEDITGSGVVYIDADMLVASRDFLPELFLLLKENDLVLVPHPGYYREGGFNRILFYLKHPRLILRDLHLEIKQGSLGTWETRRQSSAYVPRKLRKTYACGGIWFGKKEAIINLCGQLSQSINDDLKRGIIAKFHDESHLNHFAAYNLPTFATPAFCVDPTYPQLEKISPIVIAVDKKET